jgi:hypothetical protein
MGTLALGEGAGALPFTSGLKEQVVSSHLARVRQDGTRSPLLGPDQSSLQARLSVECDLRKGICRGNCLRSPSLRIDISSFIAHCLSLRPWQTCTQRGKLFNRRLMYSLTLV